MRFSCVYVGETYVSVSYGNKNIESCIDYIQAKRWLVSPGNTNGSGHQLALYRQIEPILFGCKIISFISDTGMKST